MVLVFALILFGFLLGVAAVVAAEALGISKDQARIASKTQLGSVQSDPHQQLLKKEGVVWVLEPDKVSKFWVERQSKEQKKKKELLEVSPVRKYGKINGQSLVLTDTDGLNTTIQLKGCLVEAVSATSLPSKKWAKKFPIKVEAQTSAIYHGSKTFYIYLETACEKEAWCKVLRLASCDKKEKLKWFAQLQEEFCSYLTSLNTEYHSLMKPSVGSGAEAIERASKPDGGSSKVRQFLKKLAKKTSRVGVDNKSAWTSLSGREERKNIEKLRACQDAVLATGLMKSASAANHQKSPTLDNAAPSSATLSHSGSQSHISVSSDTDADEKLGIDEGTICWNLLVSRLFFDVKGNVQMKKSIQERIQRTLSNMRTPSYVGEVICTDVNMGNVPPCIVGMRVLPMEISEVCALEVDIEYSGSALLEIETRLEVGELELQRETEGSNPELSNVAAVPSDLLEGFEYLGEQLNLAEGMNDLQEPKGDDVSKSFKHSTSSSTHGSRWKSMLNSVAKQVSQVPLSLAIRVASLKGTLRLQIKPPPSDQLWFGFTFMPDIDFSLESFVGEHKITNSHIALFLVNRLKAAIRETLVLPNCESICIPWMLAEKDDWVPRNVAPFIWIHQESGDETSTSTDTNNQPSGGLKASARTLSDGPELKQHKPPKSTKSSQEPARKSDSLALTPSSSSSITLRSSKSLEELTTPLLENDKPQETRDLQELRTTSLQNDNTHEASEEKMGDISVSESPPRNVVMDKQYSSIEQDDSRPRKIGRREKMLDLKKKMSEKFEEKKRHIEEKSRHIVEKMRGP
ncbi:Testis-expressed sequence 2 protein [Spatholobus suberectus]|nr:Testis-expressed sequence 2 protein [Spatholobus suberectus]